jgi:hypothetical protein
LWTPRAVRPPSSGARQSGSGATREFQIPAPEKGKDAKRTVFLAHNHFSGGASPQDVLHPVLDQELKKAYKGKGLGMTPEEFATRLQSGIDLARGVMEAEAQQARAQQAEGQASQ